MELFVLKHIRIADKRVATTRSDAMEVTSHLVAENGKCDMKVSYEVVKYFLLLIVIYRG
jgi:hypothetical protein